MPSRNIRMLYAGHTGSGKTGSLCSLAAAGYNVRVLDLDDGCEIHEDFKFNLEKSIYRRERPGLWTAEQAKTMPERLTSTVITEQYLIKGMQAVARGTAWNRISQQLIAWKLHEWTNRDVLVIDSFSRFCDAAMNFQLAINNRAGQQPQVGTSGSNDYTQAFKYIRDFLDLLKNADDINCHVIICCHIKFMEEPGAQQATDRSRRNIKGFPQTIGRQLSPEVGQFFNHTLLAKQLGSRRIIATQFDDDINLKSSVPLSAKPQYDLATGLAEYFKAVLERSGNG